MGFEAIDTICAKDEPNLQGAEASPEWNLPVTVVRDETGSREVVAQVGGSDGQSIGKVAAALDVEAAVMENSISSVDISVTNGDQKIPRVEVRQQPLVHVHVETVKSP